MHNILYRNMWPKQFYSCPKHNIYIRRVDIVFILSDYRLHCTRRSRRLLLLKLSIRFSIRYNNNNIWAMCFSVFTFSFVCVYYIYIWVYNIIYTVRWSRWANTIRLCTEYYIYRQKYIIYRYNICIIFNVFMKIKREIRTLAVHTNT